jgi:hypothetical protein
MLKYMCNHRINDWSHEERQALSIENFDGLSVSSTQVSRLTAELDETFDLWRKRPLPEIAAPDHRCDQHQNANRERCPNPALKSHSLNPFNGREACPQASGASRGHRGGLRADLPTKISPSTCLLDPNEPRGQALHFITSLWAAEVTFDPAEAIQSCPKTASMLNEAENPLKPSQGQALQILGTSNPWQW